MRLIWLTILCCIAIISAAPATDSKEADVAGKTVGKDAPPLSAGNGKQQLLPDDYVVEDDEKRGGGRAFLSDYDFKRGRQFVNCCDS